MDSVDLLLEVTSVFVIKRDVQICKISCVQKRLLFYLLYTYMLVVKCSKIGNLKQNAEELNYSVNILEA